MRLYDLQNNRLVYIAEQASPEYWDRHWSFDKSTLSETAKGGRVEGFKIEDLRCEITRKHFDFLVLPTTRDYLTRGSRILEGGCGTGVHVYNLQRHGFESVGIDNAPETVRLAKIAVPEMDIREGDVRSLEFPDDYFDGYWSIGVIEHFWDGYDGVLKEMYRVLKPGGYLFLTFPYMSPLRKWKARRGQYSLYENMRSLDSSANGGLARGDAPRHFYQFALDHERIAQHFTKNGFALVETKPIDGFKGLKDESVFANRILNRLTRGNTLFGKIIKIACATFFKSVAGHSILLVLQKTTTR